MAFNQLHSRSTYLHVAVGTALAMVVLGATSASIRSQAPYPEVNVRLITRVSTRSSPPGTPVEAVTITSPLESSAVLPAGCHLFGSVTTERPAQRHEGRAALGLSFGEVADGHGVRHTITSEVAGVDNVRETVTADGLILGIERIRAVPSKKETLLLLAAYAHPFLIATAEGVRLAERTGENPAIDYGAGTELRLRLTSGPPAPQVECPGPVAPEQPADDPLRTMVSAWPTITQSGEAKPADWINLALVGSKAAVERAFDRAGWAPAASSSLRADFKVFFSLTEREGYREGPVSLLTLNGVHPALVFEKQINTYAKRHHVRLWSTPQVLDRQPVWVAAATHDTAIEFSASSKHFTHRIDEAVDLERAKVIGDLSFADALDRYTLVERPDIPATSRNAAGDPVSTDGRIAVAFLRLTY